jgi:hypothetical protein
MQWVRSSCARSSPRGRLDNVRVPAYSGEQLPFCGPLFSAGDQWINQAFNLRDAGPSRSAIEGWMEADAVTLAREALAAGLSPLDFFRG